MEGESVVSVWAFDGYVQQRLMAALASGESGILYLASEGASFTFVLQGDHAVLKGTKIVVRMP